MFTNFAKNSEAAYFYKICSTSVGTYAWCTNSGTGSDGLAKFTNKMADYQKPTTSYNIYFNSTKWTPTVTFGAPIYTYYVLNDNKNNKYYRYDNHFGKKLNGVGYIQVGLAKNTGYYPGVGQRPTTNLSMKSGDPYDCAAKPSYCNTYTHASELNAK